MEPVVVEFHWVGVPVARVSAPAPAELHVDSDAPVPAVCRGGCRTLYLNVYGEPVLASIEEVFGIWPFLAMERVAWLRRVAPEALTPLVAYFNAACRGGSAVLVFDEARREAAVYCARCCTHSVEVEPVENVEALTRVELYKARLDAALYTMLAKAARLKRYSLLDVSISVENGALLATMATPELAAALILPEQPSTHMKLVVDYPKTVDSRETLTHILPPARDGDRMYAVLAVLESKIFGRQ